MALPARRLVRAGLGVGLGGLVLLGGYLGYAAHVGATALLRPEARARFRATPAALGWRYQRLTLRGHDGVSLVAWYVPAALPTDRAVLLLHGHRSSKAWMIHHLGRFLHAGYNMLALDARAHGESGGDLTTLGWHERRDAALALDRLRALGNRRVGALGVSMGAATAIGLAADRRDVAAVWADSAFDTLREAVAPRARLRGYWLPDLVAWAVVTRASRLTGLDLATADPIRAVRALAPRPLCLVHGALDEETPPACSERLFAAAAGPRSLWVVPDARHAAAEQRAPRAYAERLDAFWRQALGGR
ncbi:MAG: alpha/beta fold hydrolase [Candidatus Sericytochromatia bacterium]|nr:alpha/beta fold hydrolase [Candidatus Sericytochromatia bacterium]